MGKDYNDGNTLGNGNTLGESCCIGDSFKHGNGLKIAGKRADKIITLANIDGSGRQILLYFDENDFSVGVTCGCFNETLDEFLSRAEGEGKRFYVAIVKAADEATIATMKGGF